MNESPLQLFIDDLRIRFEFFMNFPAGFSSTILVSLAIASLVLTGEPIYRAIRYPEPHPSQFWPSVVLLQVSGAVALNCLWHVAQRFLGAVQYCEAISASIVFHWSSAALHGEQCSAVELVTYGNGGMFLIVLLLLWPMHVLRLVVWDEVEFVE